MIAIILRLYFINIINKDSLKVNNEIIDKSISFEDKQETNNNGIIMSQNSNNDNDNNINNENEDDNNIDNIKQHIFFQFDFSFIIKVKLNVI